MNSSATLDPETPAQVRDVSARLRARGRATGALVMAGFGALWAGMAASLSSSGPLVWAAIAVAATTLALAALRVLRTHPAVEEPLPAALAERRRRAGRIFLWTSIGEGLGILLAVNLAVNLGHPQWQGPAVMLVVGLHFLPLAAAFGYRPHVVTGLAMTAWALAYPWLFAAGALAPAGGFGTAALLFASAAWALRAAAGDDA